VRYAHVLRKENNMLILSRLKLILLCTIIPILILLIGSLTNYNKDVQDETTVETTVATQAEVKAKPTAKTVLAKEDNSTAATEMVQPITLPEVIITKRTATIKEQINCMAANIYHEAGGEPYMGQVAVARVVMNRVAHGFANSPCQVIYQSRKRVDPNTEKAIIHCQFSWVCQGKKSPNTNSERYRIAEEIAELVILENKWNDEYHSKILFFHNHTVNPRWPYKKTFTIGNHTFYAKN
jgi:spore germination cell wall hydrolase CwlJ-like protein